MIWKFHLKSSHDTKLRYGNVMGVNRVVEKGAKKGIQYSKIHGITFGAH